MNNSKKKIINFWEKMGISKLPGNLVTHKDVNQVSIEIKTITSLLNKKDVLLDIGCGNGFASHIYAKKCINVVGMDLSKNMIKSARKAYRKKNLSFMEGDILALNQKKERFSVIVCTRCLINLTTWNEQKKAIENMHKMLNPGGRLILTEGFQKGRKNVNKLRNKIGLPSMPDVWHNYDIDENKLFAFLNKLFVIEKDIRFGLYDILTRVNYPAIIHPKNPRYKTKYHSVAEELFFMFSDKTLDKYSREACLELTKK